MAQLSEDMACSQDRCLGSRFQALLKLLKDPFLQVCEPFFPIDRHLPPALVTLHGLGIGL